MTGSQSVQATFAGPACIVPKLKGKTLRAAKRAIRLRACTVGKIGHALSKSGKRGTGDLAKAETGETAKARGEGQLRDQPGQTGLIPHHSRACTRPLT